MKDSIKYMDITKLEMVTCCRCGKPYPKLRRDLGYKYCVNCSTEKAVSCIIEGSTDGDGDDMVHNKLVIVSSDDACKLEAARKLGKVNLDVEEPGLDMRTTEDIEDTESVSEISDVSEEDIEEGFETGTSDEILRCVEDEE